MGALARRRHILELLRKASSLAVHLFIIRILSMAGFFIALWLCPVNIFANVGLYLASLSLGNLAIFGRYDLLIINANDEQQCIDAVHLCTGVAAGAVAVALVVSQFFETWIALYFAIALFARGWLRLGLTFATRYGRYDRALKALFPHAIAQPFILVYLIQYGQDPLFAFILSDIIGHFIAAASVGISEWRAFNLSFRHRFRYRQVANMARANSTLPSVNLTAAASAFLFAITPLFFLPSVTNGVLAGTLAVLIRILDVPTSLMSSALQPILAKDVTDRNRSENKQIPRSTFVLPIIVATIIFGSISLGATVLNGLHLADNWHLALTLLPSVALFQASIAAASPLIDVATLVGRQQGLLTFNFAAVAAAVSAFFLWGHDPIFAIIVTGAIGFARVIAISAWLLVSGNDRFPPSSPEGERETSTQTGASNLLAP